MKTKVSIPGDAVGKRLSDYLSENDYAVALPCGGRGACGYCRVYVESGRFVSRYDDSPVYPDGDGYVKSCSVRITEGGAVVVLDTTEGGGLTVVPQETAVQTEPSAPRGIALDVGTTTLAMVLVRLTDGKILDETSCLNPQMRFGADVMTRIDAAKEHLSELQACLLDAVRSGMRKLLGDRTARKMTVCGNPTMLHLFLGISPAGMAAYPFTPAFTEEQIRAGASLSLPAETVYVLPSASAFIGSDVLCGVLDTGMTETDAPTVLLDIGTNGEMVYCSGRADGNRLLCASTAAGPAFEGAHISCGCGGIAGAVSHVSVSATGALLCEVIGGGTPRGLCGSGLLDTVACLLADGSVDADGSLEPDPYPLCENVTLCQKDIRELQLAKAAVRAGLETLLCEAGAAPTAYYLAGGMGYYLRPVSGVKIGLFPQDALPKIKAVGNTALSGAVRCLSDDSKRRALSAIAKRCATLELNASPTFSDRFITEMCFPDEDGDF